MWTFIVPTATTLPKIMDQLKTQFTSLAQKVACYERVASLTYGTTVRPSGEVSRVAMIRVTNTSGFTVANPTSPREGVELTFDIWNDSGGTMGTITWGSEFALTATFTNPANGKHRIIGFYRRTDAKWGEIRRSSNDMD